MKKLVLPISAMVILLLVGMGCVPLASEVGVTPTVEVVTGVEATETAPYPGDEESPPVIEAIPAEGTRPYPSLEDRRVQVLPTPEVSGPEEAGPGERPRVIEQMPPDLLEAIVADLMERAGVGRSAVHVVRTEQVIWPDGSLGCPQPDQMYTQALVDGYQVVLEQGGETYDYRVSDKGSFVLCENSLDLGAPAADAGTPTE
jgi:hypothetical protein